MKGGGGNEEVMLPSCFIPYLFVPSSIPLPNTNLPGFVRTDRPTGSFIHSFLLCKYKFCFISNDCDPCCDCTRRGRRGCCVTCCMSSANHAYIHGCMHGWMDIFLRSLRVDDERDSGGPCGVGVGPVQCLSRDRKVRIDLFGRFRQVHVSNIDPFRYQRKPGVY